MKTRILTATTLLSVVCLAVPAHAESIEHLQRLMSTKECQGCDLSNAGLVFANLSEADLSNANLTFANLSRANLNNANLVGANLTNASLVSANLGGVNLSGADLSSADLRGAYLVGANLEGANFATANLRGAIGAPTSVVTAEDLNRWGFEEGRRGNFSKAIEYYTQALRVKPDFSAVYLARGIARYRLGDLDGARQDAEQAVELFGTAGDAQGQQASEQFIAEMEAEQAIASGRVRGGGSNILNFFGSLSSLFLRLLF